MNPEKTVDKPLVDPNLLIEHLYRQTAGRLVSVLTRIMGTANLDLAESVVQDAFLKACQLWPYRGIPENPVGWLTMVAKNRARDVIRSEKRFRDKEEELITWYKAIDESSRSFSGVTGQDRFDNIRDIASMDGTEDPALLDDQLRLMFVCCHPSLSLRGQMCLTLKTVGGLSVREIARAFLSNVETTRKLIYRAKQTIRDENIPLDWPDRKELPERLDAVLTILYVIFNEGYSAYEGDRLIREDLCDEAIWLTSLFLHNAFEDLPRRPEIKALLALMLLHSSRFPARVDEHGDLVVLADQNRSLWDRNRIVQGLFFLRESATGDRISAYHLEAEIAACHATAPDYDSSDWPRITKLYDELLTISNSPIVALNKAVALSMIKGPRAGLDAVQELMDDGLLKDYCWLPATLANLYRRLDDLSSAAAHYREAIALARSDVERRFLEKRKAECGG